MSAGSAIQAAPSPGPSGAIPPRAGTSLKMAHVAEILRERPEIGWFEAHPENFMVAGGPRHAALAAVRADYPLSWHGVALSLGGAERPDRAHLKALRTLIERYQPGLVSEHLAWSAYQGVYFADLLPVPRSEEALELLCRNLHEAQEALGRPLLIENPANYLPLPDSVIPEPEFLTALARRTGCGLLVDVNNIYVSAVNLGWDAYAFIDSLPAAPVGEIHLAGHKEEAGGGSRPLLIDHHGSPVAPAVWALYRRLVGRIGARPTLLEWDNDVPGWPVLHAEARKAEALLAAPVQAVS